MRIKLTTHTLVVSPWLHELTHIGDMALGDPQCLCVEILASQEGDPTIEEGERGLVGHPSSWATYFLFLM